MNHLRSILTTLSGSLALIAGAELNVYSTGSPNMPHNDDFTVKVRTIGGEWHDLFEYKVQVDMDNPQDASMVQFDMDEPVEVMVKKNNGIFSQVDIRPLRNAITCDCKGNTVTFRIDEPKYLSVEFDGDRLHNLHLFANPVMTETYTESSDNVLYDPDLKLQNTENIEGGFDLRMFTDRVRLEYTVSYQNVIDQIFSVPTAGSTGYQYLMTNAGKMRT